MFSQKKIFKKRGVTHIMLTVTGENYNDVISAVVEKTQSELILFFVLLIIGFAIAYIPYYKLKKKSTNEYNQNLLEEKKMLYDVINRNSDIAATLTTTIDANNTTMSTLLQQINTGTNDLNKAVVHLNDNQNMIIEKLNATIALNTNLKEYVEKSVDKDVHLSTISSDLHTVINDLEYIKHEIISKK